MKCGLVLEGGGMRGVFTSSFLNCFIKTGNIFERNLLYNMIPFKTYPLNNKYFIHNKIIKVYVSLNFFNSKIFVCDI